MGESYQTRQKIVQMERGINAIYGRLGRIITLLETAHGLAPERTPEHQADDEHPLQDLKQFHDQSTQGEAQNG